MTAISKHFTLEEFLTSETASKRGFSEQWKPSSQVIANLKLLANEVAEPIREEFGSFSPTVAYRCPRLNAAVGGEKDSEHLFGCAFDETFIMHGKNISRDVFEWIIKGGLKKWSKLILEFPDKDGIPRWLHIGYNPNDLVKQVIVAEKGLMKTNYTDYKQSKYYKP